MVLWKLAIVRFVAYSLSIMIGTYKICTEQIPWDAMTHEQHVNVWLAIFADWTIVLIAFLDKTEKSIETTPDGAIALPPDATVEVAQTIQTDKTVKTSTTQTTDTKTP